MSVYGIITYHTMTEAETTYKKLKSLVKDKQISLEDAIIIVKDEDGKVKVHEKKDVTGKRGALTGGGIGLVIGLIVGGPVGGALLGGAAGALLSKKVDLGVPKDKVNDAITAMEAASSALLLEIDEEHTNLALVRAAIKQSGGTVIELNVADEAAADAQETLNAFTAGSSN